MSHYAFLIFLLTIKELLGCVCMPFWDCSSEDEFDLVDVSRCKDYFDVCCKVKCGQRKTENLVFDEMIRYRILGGGNEANFAEFPWMLGVLRGNSYRCGASLIHPKVALTVAHCVQRKGIYKVRAGEWDWNTQKEPFKHQDRLAKKILIHPKYNPNSLINDIALIIVDRNFQLTESVGIVCLPPQNSAPFSDECVLSGWGKKSHSSKRHESILNKAIFPIVKNEECEMALQRAQLGSMFKLDSSFICAGGIEKDACKGDGGSPLTCAIEGEDERYEQFGIVAWGLVCGLKNAPGVYVNVAQFVDWIDRQMANEHLDTQIYKYS